MDRKDRKINLTNEQVKKKFVSQFDLVNHAIKLATNMIQTGREARVKIDSHNRATQILSEILVGKDQFENVVVREKEPVRAVVSFKDADDEDEVKPRKKKSKH